jgi:hypothetical protein
MKINRKMDLDPVLFRGGKALSNPPSRNSMALRPGTKAQKSARTQGDRRLPLPLRLVNIY